LHWIDAESRSKNDAGHRHEAVRCRFLEGYVELEQKQLAQLLPLLPILAELGRTRHVTETAELLGLPQSTVSRALARASAAVGTNLLVRRGREIRLAPAAETLLPYVESALAEFQAGLDRVRHESAVVRGRISVAFQHTFGEATLPLLISVFRTRYPQTSFDLSQGARQACLDELAAGNADFALTAPIAPDTRNSRSAVLYREPLRLLVHHRHSVATRKVVKLSEVRTEPFVSMASGYGLRTLSDALFRDSGFRPPIAFESQDSHTVRGLVSAGLGFSIVPPSGLGPGPQGRLDGTDLGWVEVPIKSALAFREVGIAWRERNPEPDPVRLFRELAAGDGPRLLAGLVKARTSR